MWSNTPRQRVGDRTGNNWVAHISGVYMSTRLGDDDKRAVDMLLDPPHRNEQSTIGQAAMYYPATGQDGFEKRVTSVGALLRFLDAMPVEEPPADLAARTLQRIEQRGFDAPTVHASPQQHAQPKHQA